MHDTFQAASRRHYGTFISAITTPTAILMMCCCLAMRVNNMMMGMWTCYATNILARQVFSVQLGEQPIGLQVNRL